MHDARRLYDLLGAERRWVLVTAVVALLASASGVLAVALTAAGIGSLAAPAPLAVRRFTMEPRRRRSRALWGERGRISALFVDSLQGLPVIKSFNRGAAQAEMIEQRARAYRHAIMNVLKVTLLNAAI